MNIAYTMAPGRGDTDLLLFRLAETLQASGVTPAGTVQINIPGECDGPCDMDVKVLPNGPIIRISQSLGRDAKGCRLDPDALESAVALVQAWIEQGADCLIVNKFGKHEADGRGFRNVIGEALARDIPVLVGLNKLSEDAFQSFSDGMATQLPPTLPDLQTWMKRAIGTKSQAA